MRIIAGKYKGRSCHALPGRLTRPTTDRVREAWASSLVSLSDGGFRGAKVLDAFAGSGALGLEACSRGAAHTVLVEKQPSAQRLIRKNLAVLGLDGAKEVVLLPMDVFTASAITALAGLGPFDMVFLDPPYDCRRQKISSWLEHLLAAEVLAPGCLLSYERRSVDMADSWPQTLKMVSCKRYGQTTIEYHCLKQSED
ncbi:MAG: 16S rRNA (guanine(966)-N(2))-methyltransferase RsmD [Actinomycetia bacterium]|nr:16S rRNA (guanine(966)-N(2))-methyltransferase RsmD [Actinomycetes bacterium]